MINNQNIRRCSKCVLPSNYPFIKFNEADVCNYCLNFKKIKVNDAKLKKILDKHRSNSSDHDCLVGLSGGRDSVYGLYLLKEKYKMNPLAYTYDWGFIGEMARLNISNICARLGVELILRADNIKKFRYYNSLNCKALLSNIKLGMIPIVQSLDKKYLSLGKEIAKNNNIELVIHCGGHPYEQREFLIGFTGVDQKIKQNQLTYTYNIKNKLKLGFYYLKNFIYNPRYFNESFYENFMSYYRTFFEINDRLHLYDYVEWDEKKIDKKISDLGFIKSKDYGENQWRMGDTQTAFNNYIYKELCGFTEFDEFRSHQIRDGKISRKKALKLIEDDNKPKVEAIKKFCYLISVDIDYFFKKVKEAKVENDFI